MGPITCSRCGAQMKSLLISFFCPNDCDRKAEVNSTINEGILVLEESGTWIVKKLQLTDPIPDWATQGWYLYSGEFHPIEDPDISMDEWLVAAKEYWNDESYPGWELANNPKAARIRAVNIMVMGKE